MLHYENTSACPICVDVRHSVGDRPTIRDLAAYVSRYKIDNSEIPHNVEALLIRVLINETHNGNMGKFKPA